MAMNSESTFIKTSLAAAFAVGLWLGGTATSAGAVGTQAVRACDFLNSIGVNSVPGDLVW